MTPKARDSRLLVHKVADETVVYDRDEKLAHRLNETATRVWRSLDGQKTTQQVATELGIDETFVDLAVDRLAEANLLENPAQYDTNSPAL